MLLNNLVHIFVRSKHTHVRSRIWSWRIQNLWPYAYFRHYSTI